ncbi:DUF2510 domain-containing protein [Agreia pratensis]|uniref:DUF2510 domain-containing protein n=1 Tax=Agreia pratensis TaxID=150121 RepID=A0A1X7JQ15_9MICO|nr:DUF2510 domain-containing protein [Agreia pratensis]MBF4635349.1 DUF2510 domain-containing protein [Agreia pratensis]SMG30009.1 Protein of unknown function [Agreia pratensis]
MSYPPSTPQTPAGWYPDPSGTGRRRWWDGHGWTEHYEPAVSETTWPVNGAAAGYAQSAQVGSNPAAAYAPVGAPRPVAQGTPVYTAFIWLITLLPLLSIIGVALWDTDAYMRASLNSASDPFAQYTDPGYLLIQGLGFVIYGVSVLLAYFDWKTLKARGFDRPFHWAWTFIGGTVYIIGRTVVVRRRAGGGAMAPIWITIGVVVLSLIVVTVKIVAMVNVAVSYVNSY